MVLLAQIALPIFLFFKAYALNTLLNASIPSVFW